MYCYDRIGGRACFLLHCLHSNLPSACSYPSSAWLLHLAGVNELGHAKPLDRNEVGVVGLMGGFLEGSEVGSEDVGISFCGSAKLNI